MYSWIDLRENFGCDGDKGGGTGERRRATRGIQRNQTLVSICLLLLLLLLFLLVSPNFIMVSRVKKEVVPKGKKASYLKYDAE